MALSQILLRRLKLQTTFKPSSLFLSQVPEATGFYSFSTAPDATHQSPSTPKPTSLSARMSFIFEQIDDIEKKREEKDQTLQRIRNWRESKKQQHDPSLDSAQIPTEGDAVELKSELVKSEVFLKNSDEKEVELVHPWPEWVELMERLVQQNYFDHRRKDEDGMMQGLGLDVPDDAMQEEKCLNFTRDFKTVQSAVTNFGKDRFDILRSLSRQDLQILVGYGCPSTDKRVVFSSKLLRKHVHLDEGDVCSSCSLRSSCEKAYLLTNKEDEARSIDVMRILLTYGFDRIDELVGNRSLLKMKSLKTVVRKLLHDVVKLSAVPIDPNLPPPVIKKPPPKLKQPPPPPKKKVGRYDIEMKKGDWLCQKCDFMNFAKNTVCLQCDSKRPKRQLLPGEWECPQCNFLNYRRNTACFHCEHKRPPDTYSDSQFSEELRGPRVRMDKISGRTEVSNAWNFDFDDNESDGADVAAFEYADSHKLDENFPRNMQTLHENSGTHEDGTGRSSRPSKVFGSKYSNSNTRRLGVGFNDFDEEGDDVDSYDLITNNEEPESSRIDFSELEANSESEDIESTNDNWNARGRTSPLTRSKKQLRRKASLSHSEDTGVDFGSDDDLPIHPNWKSSHVANLKQRNRERDDINFGSDDDLDLSSGTDDEILRSKKKQGRWGSNKVEMARRGRYKAESFSDMESDDDFSHHRDKQRGKTGLDCARKASRDRSGMIGNKKSSLKNGFSRSSGSQQNKRDIQGNSYNGWAGQAKNSNLPKFCSHGQSESFDKRGGRSKNFDNKSDGYLDDERYRRPRINVR